MVNQCHPGTGNLACSWDCIYVLVKLWPLESQEDAHYYQQLTTRTGWAVFVEAPTHESGRPHKQ